MQRQSLGSPASKLQCHGILISGAGVIKDDNDNNFISDHHRKDKSASSSTDTAGDEERKSQKSNQQIKSIPVSSSRLVHLIPILTLFCFLILYLYSHDPSIKDSAQFSGFATISSKKIAIDSIGIDDNVGGGSMAIRSNRKLQQQERRRLHRKNPAIKLNQYISGGFSVTSEFVDARMRM